MADPGLGRGGNRWPCRRVDDSGETVELRLARQLNPSPQRRSQPLSRVALPLHRVAKEAGPGGWPSPDGPAAWGDVREFPMRYLLALSLLSGLLPLMPLPSSAASVCPESLSTADQTRCLIQALESRDRQLLQALTAVAREAKQVPGPTFQTLWRGNLTGFYRTSADPLQQAEAFRANRRAVCAYAKSVGFQGTGYGISTTRCELALTRTLLDELKP